MLARIVSAAVRGATNSTSNPARFCRGSGNAEFGFGRMLSDFSLFGATPGVGGGTVIIPDDKLDMLRQNYRNMATDLIAKGEYEKAAYVYLKLLKDISSAAHTLEQGGLYKEAAYLYHQKLRMLQKAAECYELAGLY